MDLQLFYQVKIKMIKFISDTFIHYDLIFEIILFQNYYLLILLLKIFYDLFITYYMYIEYILIYLMHFVSQIKLIRV